MMTAPTFQILDDGGREFEERIHALLSVGNGELHPLGVGWRRLEPYALDLAGTALEGSSWFIHGKPVQVILGISARGAVFVAQPGRDVEYFDPLRDEITQVRTHSLRALAVAIDAAAVATRSTMIWCRSCRALTHPGGAAPDMCLSCADLASDTIR